MKNRRQMMILDIIDKMQIGTQEELARELRKRGQHVTQATISRDINEMHLVKVPSPDGGHRYVSPRQPGNPTNDRQLRIFAESVLSMAASGNLIVIRTISGSANAAGEAIDVLEWPEIVGTIAGDNTLLVVLGEGVSSKQVLKKFEGLLK